MTQKTLILTASVVFIIAGLAFIFLRGENTPAPQTPQGQEQAQRVAAPQIAEDSQVTTPPQAGASEDLSKAFEDTLNTLLKSVQVKATSYSKDRAALFAMMSPQAIGASKDLGTYSLDVQRRAAILRAAIDEIMLSFERANASVDDLLYTQVQDEETRQALLESWQTMKGEQVSRYLSFFDGEEQIITAQLNLMALYTAQEDGLRYDEQNQRLVLSDPQDQTKADEILSFIDELQQEQAQAVKG